MLRFYFIVCFFLFLNNSLLASNYIDKGFYVIDLKNKIEWLKCTTGQQWSDEKNSCLGEAVKLSYESIEEANALLNNQIEGNYCGP